MIGEFQNEAALYAIMVMRGDELVVYVLDHFDAIWEVVAHLESLSMHRTIVVVMTTMPTLC